MKRIFLFILLALTLYGQANNFSQKTVLTTVGSTPAIDNLTQGCTAWSMGVFNQGFSGETTTLQDYTGAAWETFAGTAVVGSNPTTTLTYYLYTGTGFFPQVRATVSGLTGAGSITIFLSCWQSPNYIAALGGGSSSGPLAATSYLGPAGQTGASSSSLELNCGALSFSQCGIKFSHGGYGMDTFGWYDNYGSITAPQFYTLLDAFNLYDSTDGGDRIEVVNGANAPIYLQPGDGGVGVGTCFGIVQQLTVCGSISDLDPTGLELTSLTNGTITSGTSWTQTNDCTFPGTGVTCAYSAGTASTFSQAAGTLAIPGVGNRVYKFTYTVSGATGTPVATVTSAFANIGSDFPVNLDLINGTHILYLQSSSGPGAFTVTTTLTTGQAFTLTALSLRQVNSGNAYVGGELFMGNCTSAASPATCGNAAAGVFTIAAGATTEVVNTTLTSNNSIILLTRDDSLGTRLGVTCDTQSSLVVGTPRISARSDNISFTVAIDVGTTTNPMCVQYQLIN